MSLFRGTQIGFLQLLATLQGGGAMKLKTNFR
jgi:hypothetical protein